MPPLSGLSFIHLFLLLPLAVGRCRVACKPSRGINGHLVTRAIMIAHSLGSSLHCVAWGSIPLSDIGKKERKATHGWMDGIREELTEN